MSVDEKDLLSLPLKGFSVQLSCLSPLTMYVCIGNT